MLIIYGADFSSPANKIRYVANFLGLDYEFRRMNLGKGEHHSPEFLKLHPAGKIPVMDDNGFVLFESNAIVKYLADKAGSDIYPRDIEQRAIVDQWMDFVTIHIGGAMNRVIFNRIVAPIMKLPVDERSLSDGLNFLKRFFPMMENQLSKNPFLAGKNLTIADIDLLSVTDPAEAVKVDLSAYPAVTKWRDLLKQRDFYVSCVKDREESARRLKEASSHAQAKS